MEERIRMRRLDEQGILAGSALVRQQHETSGWDNSTSWQESDYQVSLHL